jgi:alkylation response protein AidB-like acyl-CoA dehydrogenase
MGTPLEAERQALIAEVRHFVDREVIPNAHLLEQKNEYPFDLIEKLKELGVFSATFQSNMEVLALISSPMYRSSKSYHAAG